MNRRIYKKKCKRAVEILIRDHKFKEGHFSPADGDETLDAPGKFDRKHLDRYFSGTYSNYFTPLRGTMLFWTEDYYGESDYRGAHDILQEVLYWDSISNEDVQRWAQEWDAMNEQMEENKKGSPGAPL